MRQGVNLTCLLLDCRDGSGDRHIIMCTLSTTTPQPHNHCCCCRMNAAFSEADAISSEQQQRICVAVVEAGQQSVSLVLSGL